MVLYPIYIAWLHPVLVAFDLKKRDFHYSGKEMLILWKISSYHQRERPRGQEFLPRGYHYPLHFSYMLRCVGSEGLNANCCRYCSRIIFGKRTVLPLAGKLSYSMETAKFLLNHPLDQIKWTFCFRLKESLVSSCETDKFEVLI